MKGELVVTHGYNGWGNRKSGCEAYGPGGRWTEHLDGDLLGDHLDSLGCHEGSPIIVISSTSRFDGAEFEALRERISQFLAADQLTAEAQALGMYDDVEAQS